MLTSETPLSEALERITALLAPSQKPLTFGQLRKAARLTEADTKTALESAVENKSIFRWPDYRGSQYFWRQSPDEAAQQALLAIASAEALSRTKLTEQACRQIPGFPRKAMDRIIAELITRRELQPVPAFTTGKLLVRWGHAAAYQASARKFIAEKFRKAGFTETDQPSTAIAPNTAAQLLEAIRALEPGGGPVSAQHLRNRLAHIDKRDFDAAALSLSRREEVFLSPHNNPLSLPQPERDLLIDGGNGSYYVAISIR